MKGNPVLYRTLVVGVIILFIGVGVQPAFATVEPETEIDVEPKDYLFQTIIDIANNPEVKDLLEQYKPDLFKFDIDRSVYRKLILRNPRLLFNTLLTKPSLSVEYLNKCYNNGIEITNILGEDKVIETIENVEITDRKLFDELDTIISKDKELSGRLETLKEMNKELDFEDNPIICILLIILMIPNIIIGGFSIFISRIFYRIGEITDLVKVKELWPILFYFGIEMCLSIVFYFFIGQIFECWEFDWDWFEYNEPYDI